MNKLKYIIVAAALLCGCQQKKQSEEARISALESSVSNLTWRLDRYRNISNTNADNYNADKRDWADITSKMMAMIQTNATAIVGVELVSDGNAARLDTMSIAISNIASHLIVEANGNYHLKPSEVGAVGTLTLPASVLQQIKAQAESEFPNDFEMQQYVIKKQALAWVALHGQGNH